MNFIVKVVSFVVNLVNSFIVPVVELIGNTFKFGEECECSPVLPLSPADRGKKHKKIKNGHTGGMNGTNSSHHKNVKKIKLLLDITVAQNGSQVLDVQARSARSEDEAYQQQNRKNPGFILWLLNIPSRYMLWFVHKIRKWAHDLEALKNPPTEESNRIKKSPRRRINQSNYRKIIPFFPFNLLGFSNYSPFKMPTIYRSLSPSPGAAGEATISANGKSRIKRRRNSSPEGTSSAFTDDDISFIEPSEKSHLNAAFPPPNSNGHDEVDSDETGDTLTKRMVSSSSSNDPLRNHHAVKDIARKIIVTLNASTSKDNGACGNITTLTDLDSSKEGNEGMIDDESHVQFSFKEEHNEAGI